MPQQVQNVLASVIPQSGVIYPVLVLPVGDSMTDGTGDSSNGGFRGPLYNLATAAGTPIWMTGPFSTGSIPDPFHAGVGGVTAQTVSGQIAGYVTTGSAPIVTIELGTNDIGLDGASAATTVSRLSTCLDNAYGARWNPRGRIFVMNILRRLDGFNPTVQAANALLPAMIAGKAFASYVTLIDQYNALLDGDYADAVHPAAAGYAKLAAVYWSAMSATVASLRVTG